MNASWPRTQVTHWVLMEIVYILSFKDPSQPSLTVSPSSQMIKSNTPRCRACRNIKGCTYYPNSARGLLSRKVAFPWITSTFQFDFPPCNENKAIDSCENKACRKWIRDIKPLCTPQPDLFASFKRSYLFFSVVETEMPSFHLFELDKQVL